MNTVKLLISLAGKLDRDLQLYDTKNAFLHGELNEEFDMQIPLGYTWRSNSNFVRNLKKALFGLKQSPQAWLGRFSQAMKAFDYK